MCAIRRIDELGRIVIPKEIRRSLDIISGDVLTIYVNTKVKEISIKKYEIGGKPLLDEEDNCFICPGCQDRLTYQGDYKAIKYCMLCGEKLDWSEHYGI